MRHPWRIGACVAALLLALAHASGVLPLPWVQRWDGQLADARLALVQPRTLDERVVVIDIDEASLRQIEQALVSEELAGYAQTYPDVVVRPVVRKGDPITELLELSADAAMVIVGSRGRGGFKGSVLGSTGQALIAHADAPVVVVRPLD